VPQSDKCLLGILSINLTVAWSVIAFRADDSHRSERFLGNLLLFLGLLDVKFGGSCPFNGHRSEPDRFLCVVPASETQSDQQTFVPFHEDESPDPLAVLR
jgi:hypothetical protein